jgi:hypothetical protein
MTMILNSTQLRVLGVLLEKSLAWPEYYPMTLNSIAAGCNQKSNRDPVMQLGEGEVAAAVHQLQQWQLVSQAPPERGGRANRFQHEVEQRLGWNAAQRALMTELILRGPQTLGELRGHASRMTHLESTEYAFELLKELMKMNPPMVVELPRRPGQTTTRFAHLLGGEIPASSPAEAEPARAVPTAFVQDETTVSGIRQTTASGRMGPALEVRLERLEEAVVNLQASLAGLRVRLREAGILPVEVE